MMHNSLKPNRALLSRSECLISSTGFKSKFPPRCRCRLFEAKAVKKYSNDKAKLARGTSGRYHRYIRKVKYFTLNEKV